MTFTLRSSKLMKRKDMIVLLTTLSWLIDTGLSVGAGVNELMSDPNNKINKHGMEVMRDELNDGKALSEVFRLHEDVFGTGKWRQIDAAERTGKVSECLMRIADQIQNDGDLIGKIRGAVVYPALILLLAVAAGYYMFTTIVPQMSDMLLEFEIELPALTKVMMAVSDFMINHFIILILLMVGTIGSIVYAVKKPFHYQWCKFLTTTPFIGPISVNMNYSMIYTLLSDMIENGANIVEALRVASGSATNIFIKEELQNAAGFMESDGVSLTESLIATNSMPSDDKLMLQVGSRSGREIELLGSLAVRRKAEASASVDALMNVLPTFVLLGVALVVGLMVISVYMPMISMATDLS